MLEEMLKTYHINASMRAEMETVVEAEKHLKLLGSMRRVPGHTVFSFNSQTFEIKPAPVVKEAGLGLDGKPIFKTKITIEANCIYDQALNKKNFLKRLIRKGILVPANGKEGQAIKI